MTPNDLALGELFDAIPRRISSRRYDGSGLAPGVLDRLEARCAGVRPPFGQARAVLVREAPPEVFTGLIGSYGRIEDAPTFAAFIGGADDGLAVGYVGEAVVLEALVAGADSCWIAGAFDADEAAGLVELAEGERVHAIASLGHAVQRIGMGERLMRTAVGARKRVPLDTIAPGHAEWPAWARDAAEAVRLAPSGGNTQPWQLQMDDGELVLGRRASKAYWTVPLDLGIAMLHAELGAAHAGVSGAWKAGEGADVARFSVPIDTCPSGDPSAWRKIEPAEADGTCGECGAPLVVGTYFCGTCGSPVSERHP